MDVNSYIESRIETKVPDWTSFFLADACLTSEKSPDAQTKCGCVIADSSNRIVSKGYNGFPRGANDHILPNTRPMKYDWMIHAEANAILNARISLENTKAFVSGKPCHPCLLLMHQAGIKEITYTDYSIPFMVEKDNKTNELEKIFKIVTANKLRIKFIPLEELDFFHVENVLKKYRTKKMFDLL